MNKYTIDYEKCENCGGEWIQVDYKGLVIYNKCRQKQFLVDMKNHPIKNLLKVCFYAYKD